MSKPSRKAEDQVGRVTGNAMNRQDRRFIMLETVRDRASESVTRPPTCSATLAIAVVTREGKFAGFDAGRVAQSMMPAAWNPERRTGDEWQAAADRARLDDIVRSV